MQIAPNSEEILAYLHERNFQYSSERALVEACKDLRTFVNLLRDLLEPVTPSYTRAWQAAQSYTFTNDVQRNRVSLPVVNDSQLINENIERIGLKIRLVEPFTKKGQEKVMIILSRVIGFVQAHRTVAQKISKQRESHQKSQLNFKGTTEILSEFLARHQQVKNQKERERSKVEGQLRTNRELKNRSSQLYDSIKQILKIVDQFEDEMKQLKSRQAQSQMQIENKNIKINQIKRQLVKLAPDIKRQKQNMMLKLTDLKDRIQYCQRVWSNINEQSQSNNIMLGAHEQKLRQWLSYSKEELNKYNQLIDKISEEGGTANQSIPKIAHIKEGVKHLIEQNSMIQNFIRTEKENSREITNLILVQKTQLEECNATQQQGKEHIEEGKSFREMIEIQRNSALLKLNMNLEGHEKRMEAFNKLMKLFCDEINFKNNEFQTNFVNIGQEL